MTPPRTRRPAPRAWGTAHAGRASGPGALGRAWPWALAALFAFALAWRLAYLGRLAASPMAGVLPGDERDYWDWATHLLAHGGRGVNPFFQGPLYPYLLALVRAVLGSEPEAVFRVQAVFGAASAVLLADAARRVARPWVALAAGVAVAGWSAGVMFDGLVLVESLLLLLESLLVWTWCRAGRSASPGRALVAAALLCGLAAQCRATSALLLLPTLWLAARAGAPTAPAVRRRSAAVLAAFALTVVPSAAWNASRVHAFVPFTYNAGYNLYVGQNPEANGTWVSVTGTDRPASVPAEAADGGAEGDGREYLARVRHVTLSPAASSAYWASLAWADARRDPARVLALWARKLALMWNRRETPQLESPELFERFAGPVGLPVVGTFAFLGTLALAGLAFAGGAGPAGGLARAYVLIVTASVLPFFATDRYRVHLLPGLALLAALAAEAALARWRSRGVRGLAAPALALACAAVVVALPVRERDAREDAWRAERDLGARWLEHGDPQRAAAEFETALRLQRELGLDRDPDVFVAQTRGRLDYDYGVALHRLGRDDESLRWFSSAAHEDTANSIYLRTLADADVVNGREREADSLLRRVGGLVGGEGELLISRGWAAARAGRMDEAEASFRRAVTLDDRLFGGWAALVRVQVERGEWRDARASLERARALRMPAPTLLAHEALLDAASGDAAGARRALAAIPPSALAGDRLLQSVVDIARARLGEPR